MQKLVSTHGFHDERQCVKMMWFESEDSEAVKKMSEAVAETRDELLSITDGMNLVPLTVGTWQVKADDPRSCE